MSITVRSDRHPVVQTADTCVGAGPTPLPATFPFLRPAMGPDEIGRLGPYRVLRLLGAGGMGKVFLAEDPALKRAVALKVMCASSGEDVLSWRERFLREARALAAINHPNLVTVYQVGDDRGTVFLAMELLEGETLDARMTRPEPMEIAEVVRIGTEVATGLAAIHARGLIHRDIKPGNVWLCGDGCAKNAGTDPDSAAQSPPAFTGVKILDFGLVREIQGDTHLTEVGAVVGTPAYMSPEQIRGRSLDHRTDLFSFGCMLYAMSTGRRPFDASTPLAQAAALAADTPPSPRQVNPNVPAGLSALIEQLLAKSADERPASAVEVIERLRTACTEPELVAIPLPLPEPEAEFEAPAPPKPRPAKKPFYQRHAVGLVVGASLVAAVVAVGAVVALQNPRQTDTKAPPAAPAPAPKSALKSAQVVEFITDLPKIDGRQFPPPDAPPVPGVDGTVTVRGARSAHGIFMHGAPSFNRPPYATYALDKKYSRFTTEVAMNDTGSEWTSVAFAVYRDGKEVWTSRQMSAGDPPDRCDIDVKGAVELTLEVRTLGPHQGAHGAWIDPRLTK
jgi:serine/threonine protein kinase